MPLDIENCLDEFEKAYVAIPEFVMTKESTFESTVKAVHKSSDRAVDINTLMDLKIAKTLHSNMASKH